MVENQIDLKLPSSNRHHILSTDESESSTKFEEEIFHIVFESSLQFAFFITFLVRQSRELQDIRVMNNIISSQYRMTMSGKG